MQTDLRDKVVLVTGSARRVGRAIALGFAKQGATLVIHHGHSAQDAESAANEAREFGVKAIVVSADLTKPAAVTDLFQAIREHYGRLDVVVNSAASFYQTPFLEVSFEEW